MQLFNVSFKFFHISHLLSTFFAVWMLFFFVLFQVIFTPGCKVTQMTRLECVLVLTLSILWICLGLYHILGLFIISTDDSFDIFNLTDFLQEWLKSFPDAFLHLVAQRGPRDDRALCSDCSFPPIPRPRGHPCELLGVLVPDQLDRDDVEGCVLDETRMSHTHQPHRTVFTLLGEDFDIPETNT